MDKSEQKLYQAIQYARLGWPVFPCKHFGKDVKKPRTMNGFHDATTDEEQILDWWTDNPKSLIGIPTGKKVGFWVVDVDIKNGKDGSKSLREAFGNELFDKATLIQGTPTGGKHILFKWDDNRPVKCGTDLLDGIDIRGEGGYIIVAPSGYFINDKWEEYRWNSDDFTISEAPAWAYQLANMKGRHSKTDGSLDLAQIMTGVEEGGRDEALNRYAWHLAGQNVPVDLALAFMQTAAGKCKPPMSYEVVEYQLQRAYSEKQTKNKGIDNILVNAQNKNKKEA